MKKKIYLVIGTVLLGAIGSGLWDVALNPALSWLGDSIWGMIVRVSSTVEQSVYTDIAEDRQETLKMMSGLLVVIVVLSFFSVLFDIKPFLRQEPQRIPFRVAAVAYIVTIFVITFISLAKNEYIQVRREDYSHLLVIIKPYTTNQEIDQLNSRFARIHTKKGYQSIIKQIKDIARDNGVALPLKYDN